MENRAFFTDINSPKLIKINIGGGKILKFEFFFGELNFIAKLHRFSKELSGNSKKII